MTQPVSHLLKINVRARSKDGVGALLLDILGADPVHDRGADTIGEFEGNVVQLGGVMFDIVVPTSPDSALAKVIDQHGEGIDSICFAVDDIDTVRGRFAATGVEFARLTEFHGNKVGFVRPRDACGIGLEFIEGPLAER